MKSFSKHLKGLVKDVTPPVLLRVGRRFFDTSDPLGVALSRSHTMTLRNQYVLRHRGTPADRAVLGQLFIKRAYDPRPLARYADLQAVYNATVDPLIVDCGANIGASAVWFKSLFPKAMLVAIEPERHNFELLQQNVRQLSRVTALRTAVSDRSGRIVIEDPGMGEWAYRTRHATTLDLVDGVPATTIDQVVDSHSGTPFILKIDVEGAEEEIFAGSCTSIDRFPLIIIELHDWLFPRASKSRSFLDWHASHNRDFVSRHHNIFSIAN